MVDRGITRLYQKSPLSLSCNTRFLLGDALTALLNARDGIITLDAVYTMRRP